MPLDTSLLRRSFDMVLEREPALTRRFYEILFERYPQVSRLFGRNTAEAQQQMLAQALGAVIDHLEDATWLANTLRGMGAKHVEYGVTDEMYHWVGDSLLATLAEVAGDDWSDELAAEWAAAYRAISGLMLEGAAARAA